VNYTCGEFCCTGLAGHPKFFKANVLPERIEPYMRSLRLCLSTPFFYRHQISCCLVAILLCLGVSVIFFSFYSFVMFCCHTIDLDSTCLLMPFDFDPPKRAKRYTISSVLTKRLFDVAISLECSPPINSFFFTRTVCLANMMRVDHHKKTL
jgi:hypothetical protein